jgi:hypothetical protein
VTRFGIRSTISRWANASDQEARDLRRAHTDADCVPIDQAPDRDPVTLRGSVRTVSLRPRAGVPALEAELFDGTGVVTLIWLGRRRIAGIDPGRTISVQGRVGRLEDARVMYNPRYELIA